MIRAGKEGLAAITGQMLADASTTRNTYAQIIDKLYPLAAGYAASVSAEMTVISGRVHKDNLEAFYPLLHGCDPGAGVHAGGSGPDQEPDAELSGEHAAVCQRRGTRQGGALQ